ncbi:diacylglycerol O-acyltransferase 1-like isoform X3 [Clupea harengus]|uniref:diacylglycerol O-acyltransferase n=1 Tax=Clupea harengus TaxID=7950 RepID=A0A6P8FAB1_CLUHA|nr:diacylglycerol O-acyltransferase 1-like isoform X3 [Clupea harengus]
MSVLKAYLRGQSLSQSEEEHTCAGTDSLSPLDMLCCHSVQDSLLSSNSRFTNYRGILNWIVILLMLTYAHLFLENFIQHGFLIDLKKALELLIGDNYWPYLYLILAANVFPMISVILEKSQEKGSLSSSLAYWLHIGNLAMLAAFPTSIILLYETSLSTGGALLSLFTYTILWLKLYSYQQVSSWYRESECTEEGMR